MSEHDRLVWIENILGLMPSRHDSWEDRAAFWAFLVAGGAGEEQIAAAQEEVERLRPGWVERVSEFVERDLEASRV